MNEEFKDIKVKAGNIDKDGYIHVQAESQGGSGGNSDIYTFDTPLEFIMRYVNLDRGVQTTITNEDDIAFLRQIKECAEEHKDGIIQLLFFGTRIIPELIFDSIENSLDEAILTISSPNDASLNFSIFKVYFIDNDNIYITNLSAKIPLVTFTGVISLKDANNNYITIEPTATTQITNEQFCKEILDARNSIVIAANNSMSSPPIYLHAKTGSTTYAYIPLFMFNLLSNSHDVLLFRTDTYLITLDKSHNDCTYTITSL